MQIIHYYQVDDTVEIQEVHEPNGSAGTHSLLVSLPTEIVQGPLGHPLWDIHVTNVGICSCL